MTEQDRREALYATLCEIGDKFTAQHLIYGKLAEYYPPLDGRTFHDSTARVQMSADISAINRDPVYEKIIVSTPRGIKIANKEEARSMISARHAAALRELQTLNILTAKFDKDGQNDADGETRAPFVGGAL